jgi:hypothetical protein
MLEVEDDADGVQPLPCRHCFHAPVMAVEGLDGTAALGQPMGGTERRLVGDLEH